MKMTAAGEAKQKPNKSGIYLSKIDALSLHLTWLGKIYQSLYSNMFELSIYLVSVVSFLPRILILPKNIF